MNIEYLLMPKGKPYKSSSVIHLLYFYYNLKELIQYTTELHDKVLKMEKNTHKHIVLIAYATVTYKNYLILDCK